MIYIYSSFFFVMGLIMGSFFNVVGLRVPKGDFLKEERSYCPKCKKTLKAYELIPVVSYLLQAGKCRGCKQAIAPIYPAIELLTGLGFLSSYLVYGFSMELGLSLVIVSLSVIIIVTDLTYYLIPNKLLLIFLPLIMIMRFVAPLNPWWSSPVGALVGFGLIFAVILLSQGGMGAGDMKYFFVLGYAFGVTHVLLIFLLSTIYGTLVNMVLLAMGKVTRKSKVPFGPYISLAALTVLFVGEPMINWYFGFF